MYLVTPLVKNPSVVFHCAWNRIQTPYCTPIGFSCLPLAYYFTGEWVSWVSCHSPLPSVHLKHASLLSAALYSKLSNLRPCITLSSPLPVVWHRVGLISPFRGDFRWLLCLPKVMSQSLLPSAPFLREDTLLAISSISWLHK